MQLTGELQDAFELSHGILFKEMSGIRSPDSPGEIPGGDLCCLETDLRKHAICERGPRRLRRLPRTKDTEACRLNPRGAASLTKAPSNGVRCPPLIS
jgi:hypothetical protein